MSTVQYAGQFVIEKCELITSAGLTINLSSSILEINIFEDIYSNALKGSILCFDTNSLITNTQILGQDYLRLKITTPGFESNDHEKCLDFTDNVFSVYKIGARNDASTNSEVFELSFMSPEALTNLRKRVSKSLTGSPSEIFETLMKSDYSINTGKKLYVEQSSGVRKYVVPNVHPYQFIQSLMEEAVSADTQSPFYLFFENTNGYHFRTLQSLYNQDTKADFNLGDPGELQDVGSKVKDIEKEFRTIIADDSNNNSDMLKNIVSGLLANKLRTVDIFNKEITSKDHNYFDDYKKFDRIEGSDSGRDNPIYNDAPIEEDGSRISDYPDTNIHLIPYQVDKDTGGDPLHYNSQTESYSYTAPTDKDSVQFLKGKMVELATTLSRNIKVNGHTAIACGDTVNISKPDSTAKDNGFLDELETGKYLITAARHIFSTINNKHEIVMTCNKDSHPKAKKTDGSIVREKSVPKGKVIVRGDEPK